MKAKKEKSTILVIFTILVLAIFIILPPVFRKFYPKETKTIERKKIDLLSCAKDMETEGYQITTTTRYEDDELTSARIVYTKGTTEKTNEATTIPNNIVSEDNTLKKELEIFQAIPEIEIEQTNTKTTITLTKEIIEKNTDNLEISSYVQPILSDQQTYYENQGYICSFMTG